MTTSDLIGRLQDLLAEKARALESDISDQSDKSHPPRARDEPPEKEPEKDTVDPGTRPPELEGLSWRGMALLEMDGAFDERPDILRWLGRRCLPGQLYPRLKYIGNNNS